MKDLIDREAAIDALGEAPKFKIGLLKKYAEGRNDQWFDDVAALVKLPSAQPETAKRIVGKPREGMTFWYQCSMCNEPVDAQDNYCCGCGRRLIDEWLD